MGEDEGAVASYLNGSWVPDCKIQIVLQPSARGPGDALALASNYLTGSFLLASCVHLTSSDQILTLMRRFRDNNADMVLSVAASGEDTVNLPTVKVDGDRVTAVSMEPAIQRRSLGAFMLYACGKRLLNHTTVTAPSDYEMAPAIQALIASNARVNFVTAEWHMQLYQEIDLLTINKRFLREGRDTHILSEIPGSVHIIPPVRIDPQVSVGQGSKIGPNVYLESGAQVGPEAVIWDSVILNKAEIASQEVVHGQIVGRRMRISEEAEIARATQPRKPRGLDEYLSAQDDKKTQ
jgi:NDP-sugar pyrophosphorylase family protein